MCLVLEVRRTERRKREHSSAGRAHALQAWGHRFEPCCSHQYGPVVQSVSTPACHAGGRRFESVRGRQFNSAERKLCTTYASVAQLVEQWTENPRVVGSIPTGGTTVPYGNRDAGVAHPVERHLAKVEVASSSLVTRSIRYRGQVVRQESAKLSFASSNLAGTSKMIRVLEMGHGFFLLIFSSLALFYQQNPNFFALYKVLHLCYTCYETQTNIRLFASS